MTTAPVVRETIEQYQERVLNAERKLSECSSSLKAGLRFVVQRENLQKNYDDGIKYLIQAVDDLGSAHEALQTVLSLKVQVRHAKEKE